MEENIYAAPKVFGEEVPSAVPIQPFYIVSPRKFTVLYLMTLGLYGAYWFYKNWKQYKLKTGMAVRPVLRGIFSIFFTHRLFQAIDGEVTRSGSGFSARASALATPVVVISIVIRVVDRMSAQNIGSPLTDLLSLAGLGLEWFLLSKVQTEINLACRDPEGQANSRYTLWNFLWVILGAVLLFFVGVALVESLLRPF